MNQSVSILPSIFFNLINLKIFVLCLQSSVYSTMVNKKQQLSECDAMYAQLKDQIEQLIAGVHESNDIAKLEAKLNEGS